MKKHKRFGTVSVCCVFLVLLFGLTAAGLLKKDKEFSENENRYLEKKPEFSLTSLYKGEYTKKYEAYITDQFVCRDSWIGLKTRMERAALKRDVNGVFFAEDGYLIEKHEETDIDKKQERKNINRLSRFVKETSERLGTGGVKVLLVPTASDILRDKLPAHAPGFDQGRLLHQVKSKMPDNFIDIEQSLKKHKEDYIYYRTDHHWTTLGAYYAYEEWAHESGLTPFHQGAFQIKKVTDKFYGTLFSKVNIKVHPDDINIYIPNQPYKYKLDYNMGKWTSNTLYDEKKLKEKDKYSVFLGGNNPIVRIDTDIQNNRKLLVIKDSFAHSFVPFAVNHFEQTYMVDFRYFKQGMKQFIAENKITDVLVLYNTYNFATDKNSIGFVR